MSKYPNIPGYRIEDVLGEGGMATVYLGIQEKLNRKVAIKILEPSLLKNPSIRERFLIEAETAANISHTHIVSIIDIGHVEQYQYIVMEYLKETLKDHMYGYADFKIKPEIALKILKPISEALDHAHSRGIIHRDIKTENIMFREDNTPVLVDFGIARVLDSNSQMTRTGLSLGTPYYMSPEQCQAEKLDGRSDFYSLGVVLFEIITGEKPYMADNPTAVAIQHIQDPVPLLPPELSRYQILIDKMMAKNREDRVANGAELRKLIDSLLQTTTQPLVAPPAPFIPEVTPPSTPSKTMARTAVDFQAKTQPVKEITPKPQPITQTTITKTPPIPKKFPIKTIAEASILLVLLVVIFMIFFSLGQGTQKKPTPTNKNNLTEATQQKRNTPSSLTLAQWQEDYQAAKTALTAGDWQQAKTLVLKLKAHGASQSLPISELETDINNEETFQTYQINAESFFKQKEYKKALENLLRAQSLKNTPALEALQKRIDTILGKSSTPVTVAPKKENTPATAIDEEYNQALAENTIAAYRHYISNNPQGSHINDAMAKINKLEEDKRLQEEALTKSTIKKNPLRSQFKTLNFEKAQTMMMEKGYFENEFNKTGDFKNNFETQTIANGVLVIDQAVGLMWYGGIAPKPMNFKKADSWVKDLNRQQYGGFSNWRLPTLEEAATLLEKRVTADGLHIAPVFRMPPQNIWTGDAQRPQTLWVIRFDSGTIYADSERSLFQALAVRSSQ